MRPILIAWLFLATSAFAQTSSTLCQANPSGSGDVVEQRLVGCGEGFATNLLWHLDRSDSIDGALDTKVTRTLTGRGAVIYVIDSGVMAAHDEFARATGSNVIAGIRWQAVPDCPNVATAPCWGTNPGVVLLIAGHGTGVASVAAGRHTGIAPDASIVAVAPLPGNTTLYKTLLQRIIEHAFAPQTPAFRTAIISISSGPPLTTPRDAALDALMVRMTTGVDAGGNADPNGKRFLFVAAAGNYYADFTNQCGPEKAVILHPAILGKATEGIIAVGGIDRDNQYWAGACNGDGVEMAGPAPDMFVASISSNDAYRYRPALGLSGTSWSTPYVSGMAALWLERYPDLTPAQLESLLASSPSRVNGIPVPVMPDIKPEPTGPRRRATRH